MLFVRRKLVAAVMECDQDECVCVECGHMPCVLVRRFPGGIIKIEQCVSMSYGKI